jgi:hypothetical protein
MDGGSLTDIALNSSVPDLLVAAITAQAGNGSDGVANGVAGGNGGSITNFKTQNIIATALQIFAGNGGAGGTNADGGNGGSLTDIIARAVAADYTVQAGTGGLGDGTGIDGSDGVETNVLITVG